MSIVRKELRTGRWSVQCEVCRTFVPVTDAQWRGADPLPPHAQWRSRWLHALADGRVWILRHRRLCRLIDLVENVVRPKGPLCTAVVVHDYASEWPTSGLASFGPSSMV
jgi:hypothetical protein